MTKILVLEDEPSVAMLLRMVLLSEDYDVAVASDFFEARELYDAAEKNGAAFDIVLTDLNNPGLEHRAEEKSTKMLGGLDLMTHVRMKNPDFPIVLISGGLKSGILEKDPVLFANITFLAKPFQNATLVAVLASALVQATHPGGGKVARPATFAAPTL